MNEDTEINIIKNIQKIPGKHLNTVTNIMSLISAPFHCKFYILVILVLYLIGKITTGQVFILCSSQFIIFTIKYIVKRKRPFQVDNNIKLLETMGFDEYSFPSGHTLNAFLLSYMLRKNIGLNLNIIPYMVGLSRIFLGVHYPSDVLGGLILTKIILHSHKF
jgi:membrane-associated phospholipid phosphatase